MRVYIPDNKNSSNDSCLSTILVFWVIVGGIYVTITYPYIVIPIVVLVLVLWLLWARRKNQEQTDGES